MLGVPPARHDPENLTRADVARARDNLIMAIRNRANREHQLTCADLYISAIKAHAKATGRKLPVPNRFSVIRQLS